MTLERTMQALMLSFVIFVAVAYVVAVLVAFGGLYVR